MGDSVGGGIVEDMEKELGERWLKLGIQGKFRAPEEINISENRTNPKGKFDKWRKRGDYYAQTEDSKFSLKSLQTLNDAEIKKNLDILASERSAREKDIRDNLTRTKNDITNFEYPFSVNKTEEKVSEYKSNLEDSVRLYENKLRDSLMEFDISELVLYLASQGYRPIRFLPHLKELKSAYSRNEGYTKYFRKKLDRKTGISQFVSVRVAKKGPMTVTPFGLTGDMTKSGDPSSIFTINRNAKGKGAYIKLFRTKFEEYLSNENI